jgi:acyl-CoA synthetase (AMP-forming)/AMP-acid ligase II
VWLTGQVLAQAERIDNAGIPRGAVAAIHGDFSPNAVAFFLALLNHGCVLVPLTASTAAAPANMHSIAQVEFLFALDAADCVSFEQNRRQAVHPLYAELRRRGHAGLVLFSSGPRALAKPSYTIWPRS